VAKTTDVDGMLDSMTHAQFDEWCAKDLVEPIGTPTAMGSVLAKIGMIISAFAGFETEENYFMPWIPPKDHDKTLTAKESGKAITAHLQMMSGGP
tara:strand:- start:700 stop:984 length:285 start_codon:yes stop_codon:yes gene_type:complete